MGNMILGYLCSAIPWVLLICSIAVLRNLSLFPPGTGWVVFVLAAIALYFSVCYACALGKILIKGAMDMKKEREKRGEQE